MRKSPEHKLPINPRYGLPALSWSDLVAIEQDVHKWYQTVTGVRRKLSSPAMSYGTYVHAQVSRRKLKHIPCGNNPECEQSCTISYRHNRKAMSFMIVGKPDDTDETTIYEYKTGLKLWSKKQAENHGQLFTYALLRKHNTGICPTRALLVSLETTNDEDAGLVLTGNTRIHEVPITAMDILKIQARFVTAYKSLIHYLQENS